MMETVQTISLCKPSVSKKEILRYAGAKMGDEALDRLVDECLSLAEDHLTYRAVYAVYPITHTETGVSLGTLSVASRDLAKNLNGCHAVILFGASVGRAIDRLVLRESVLSPARALLLDAYGTERVEALADALCDTLAAKYGEEGCVLRPRFSPGYGDLPLSTQREIFSMLDLPRRLNVTLNDSLLISPKKTVTAFVGIAKKE